MRHHRRHYRPNVDSGYLVGTILLSAVAIGLIAGPVLFHFFH